MKKKLINLFYLLLPLVLGSLVGLIIRPFMDYDDLVKPFLAPPKILFPIAWTIIYFLMGLSYYLYKKKQYSEPKISFVYYLQLFVNLLWSIIFFVCKWYLGAALWIVLLDVLVIWLLVLFYKNYKLSFYLNLLYLVWILFATYLTWAIYFLN